MPLNVKNRTLFIHDNLDILNNINSETVDLIYLDPPFNSNKYYAAPIGSEAAGASFKDAWTLNDIDLAWIGQIAEKYPAVSAAISATGAMSGTKSRGSTAYLVFMARRLLEMHRILKPTGSIYLHCDPTASHYLKVVMDAIFGAHNFRNEIIWCYHGPGSPKMRQFNRKHDIIFWYAKGKQWTFNKDDVRMPYQGGKPNVGGFEHALDDDLTEEYGRKGKIPESWWYYAIAPRSSTEYVGYPTQKPIKLLERIIRASSNEDDMILDPFCGCATTMVAAERLQRRWLGIDISGVAVDLIKRRLWNEQHLYTKRVADKVIARHDIPRRTDNGAVMVNPREYKHTLYGLQEGRCAGCRYHFPFQNFTIDHILPRIKGGQNIEENLQLLCGSCNSIKGDREMAYLLVELKKRGVLPTLTTTQKRRKQS